MLEPKTITIDEMKFNLKPLPALKALKLDKKMMSLIAPALGGFKGLNLDSEIDMGTLMKGFSEALSSLKDDEFENIILDLLSTTIYLEREQPPQEVTSQIVNRIFQQKLITLYKLLFEVMQYNKFSPFELVEGGIGINKIHTLFDTKKKENKNGNKSEKSGNLLET